MQITLCIAYKKPSVCIRSEISAVLAYNPHFKKKSDLVNWTATLERCYADRIPNIDKEVVHLWGALIAQAQIRGKIIPAADGLIAATALAHDLHVMTRNVSDFAATGVLILAPWQEKV